MLLASLLFPLLAFTATAQTTFPYETDFESADGYSLGPLTSDPDWQIGSGLDAAITAPGAGSAQAFSFTGADWLDVIGSFDPASTPTVSWVDFYLQPVFADETELPAYVQTLESAVTGFVKVDDAGTVYAIDGDGQGGGAWTPSGTLHTLAADEATAADWMRLTYRLDHSSQSWDLFIDGQLRLFDLGFLDSSASALSQLSLRGDGQRMSLLDYVYAGATNPLFIDTSGDGLPDDWLVTHGLNPSLYQRYADTDLDGFGNIDEYRLGTSPVLADSDGDGLDDGLEHLLGHDPAVAETHALGTIPFADGFESDTPGSFLSGTRLWTVEGEGTTIAAEPDAPEGLHYLANTGDDSVTLSRFFEDPAAHTTAWIDLRLKVGYQLDTPEMTAPRAASVFYFAADGQLRVLDGNAQGGGQWLTLDHTPVEEGDWARLSVCHDYAAQTWSLWIDDARYAQGLGFRDTVPAFSHLQFDQLNALDDVSVGATEPNALDNDGDGLTNAEELALGTDPDNPDTSGDGWTDYEIYVTGEDPTQSYLSSLPFVETFVTHVPGALGAGTNNWFSFGMDVPQIVEGTAYEDGVALLLPATGDMVTELALANRMDGTGYDTVWTDIVMTPALFPEHITPEVREESSVLFYFGDGGKVYAYDGVSEEWLSRALSSGFDAAAHSRITVKHDFQTQLWDLWIDGESVFDGLGFATPVSHYRGFALLAASDEATTIDSVRIGTDAPTFAMDTGLIGHWPLDGDAADYSGNDYHGTLLSGASFVPNPDGQGQVLQSTIGDPETGHVRVGLPTALHPGQGVTDYRFSGSVWVQFDDRQGMAHALNYNSILGNPPGMTYVSRYMGQDQIWTMVRSLENGHPSTKNFWPRSQVSSVDEEGRWYHVAWTFHSHNQGEEGHFRWYIDGQLSAEYTGGIQTNNTNTFRIGADYSARAANTKIAEVRLYDRVLSAAEVAYLHETSRVVQLFGDFPQWWIDQYFPGQTSVDPDGDPDGDGASNLDEYLAETDPNDFYDSALPELVLIAGDGQSVAIGEVAALPLTVQVQKGETLLNNAPIYFTILPPGIGSLASLGLSGQGAIDLRADTNGRAEVDYAATGEDIPLGSVTIRVSAHSGEMETYEEFTLTIIESNFQPRLFAGLNQSYIVADGSITAVGEDSFAQVSGADQLPGNIEKIVAGEDHVVALTSDGKAYAWGDNFSGQLGTGTFSGGTVPVEVAALNGVVDIAAGDRFTVFLVDDGSNSTVIKLAGDLSGGLKADAGLANTPVVVDMSAFNGREVVEIAAAGRRILARCADGSLWAWGDNRFGHSNPAVSDLSLSVPSQVLSSAVVSIYASPDVSLALKANGDLVGWGNSAFGQIAAASADATAVKPIAGNVTQASAGNGFVTFVNTNNELYSAGLNDQDQLGRNTASAFASAAQVDLPNSETIMKLVSGDHHTIYLTNEISNRLYGFGDNRLGALGEGAVISIPMPSSLDPNF